MKNLLRFIAIAVVAIALYAFSAKTEEKVINVVIDAGHGGDDKGAVYKTFTEKDITALVANKIKELNKDVTITIHLTRSDDQMLTLPERANMINQINPDLFISLHVNANANSESNGVEAFIAKESLFKEQSQVLAHSLVQKLSKASNVAARGVNEAPFFLLKKVNCPGIVLELGFISNEDDRSYLTKDENQVQIANTILDFVSTIK
jgi:N-acetylmuramoyl-L-alanine amidase